MKTGLLEATAAALLLLVPAAGKGEGVSFAYQGALLNERGQVLSQKNHTIVFRLYNQATGGTELWSCTKSVRLNESGLFSIELSGNAASGKTLGEIMAENASGSLYIGLTVDTDTAEIEPRQKLLPVPKAFRAADCVAASGDIDVNGNLVGTAAAETGNTTANSLKVTNGMTCKGKIMPGSLHVAGDLSVTEPSSISGKGTIPIGGIVIWSGEVAKIPEGWALCNGQVASGLPTPNLTDQFVIGVSSRYERNQTGGEKEVELKDAHLPPHAHNFRFKGANLDLAWKDNSYLFDATEHYPNNVRHKTTGITGGLNGNTMPHDNMPPYYALCYIMRVK